MKSNFYTALMVIALIAVANQFEVTRGFVSGGNKFFK